MVESIGLLDLICPIARWRVAYLSDHLTKRNLGIAFVMKQHKSLQKKLPKKLNKFTA